MKQTFFIEIVMNNEGKTFKGDKFLRGLVVANSVEEAKEEALNHFKPLYTAGDKGEFKVQCAWAQRVPTKKVLLECRENVFKMTMPMAVRDKNGEILGYRHPKFFDDKKLKDIEHLWSIGNFTWDDVYYDNKLGCYVVTINPYMCDSFIVKTFEGKTKETYEEALAWVEKNTLKKTHYHKP